jgi:hypothetical protein
MVPCVSGLTHIERVFEDRPVSRGLGRWQRVLLHGLYHEPVQPKPIFSVMLHDVPYVRTRAGSVVRGSSEDVAIRRAARSLVTKGLAADTRFPGCCLEQVVPTPDIVCPEVRT